MGQVNAAKYTINEVSQSENYRQSFALDINNSGKVIGAARDSYNFPFYIEPYLSSETGSFQGYCALSDAELSSGDFDSSSTGCVKVELARTSATTSRIAFGSSPFYQKVGDFKSFWGDETSTTTINVFDIFDDELGDFTRSNVEQIRAINDNDMLVGYSSAPYQKVSFQQTGEDALTDPITVWQQDFVSRAFAVVNNEVIELPSEETLYGGFSAAMDISEANYVAGYEAVDIYSPAMTTVLAACTDEYLPEQVCAWGYIRSGSFFEIRPVVWQLDNSGNVISKTQYDIPFTPNEDQTGLYTSRAVAVNDLGVAVGYGHVPYNDENSAARDFPVVFQNGTTTEMITDYDDYDRGYALDINNNNIIVGNLDTYFDGTYNNEFFIYDLNSGSLETPTTFYSTAQSTASSINDSGVIVGQAEYEITTSQTRRKHGFIYDSVKKEFFDINDLTECGSAYEIVETSAINNNGQIAATALKMVDRKNYLGEVLIDPTTGEAYQEQVAVSVMLDPIDGGELEECTEEQEPDYERKGLSLPLTMSLLLSGFVAIRRKFL